MSEPRRILSAIWKWLPAFRSVAESQSVSQAARALGVSPPAISRALKQMEEELGRELFDRKGRQVILNASGGALLEALREVDVRLEEVIDQLSDRETAGTVRLAAVGQLGRVFLLPAVRTLSAQYPRLQLSILHLEPEVAIEQLTGGLLDLFLGLNIAVGEPLSSSHLADLELAIYAGKGHPLFEAGALGPEEELERYGFVAQKRPGLMRSVWPRALKRRIALETDSHAVALDACLGGTYLMVMERVIARQLVAEGRLCELRADFLEPARVVLCRNAHSAHDPVVSRVAEAIAKTVAEIVSG